MDSRARTPLRASCDCDFHSPSTTQARSRSSSPTLESCGSMIRRFRRSGGLRPSRSFDPTAATNATSLHPLPSRGAARARSFRSSAMICTGHLLPAPGTECNSKRSFTTGKMSGPPWPTSTGGHRLLERRWIGTSRTGMHRPTSSSVWLAPQPRQPARFRRAATRRSLTTRRMPAADGCRRPRLRSRDRRSACPAD